MAEVGDLRSTVCLLSLTKHLSIQLWALLHFIMPTLFDSHEEFTEWFSKDIESHAETNSALNERTIGFFVLHSLPFV